MDAKQLKRSVSFSISEIFMILKGSPHTQLVTMLIGAATMEDSLGVPQKLRLELPYDPSSTSGYLPKELKPLIQKDICMPTFIAALCPMAET